MKKLVELKNGWYEFDTGERYGHFKYEIPAKCLTDKQQFSNWNAHLQYKVWYTMDHQEQFFVLWNESD